MGENRYNAPQGKEMVCIDTYRVLDSCRDKDCYEDVRVYLTEGGQSIIDRTCAIRVKNAKVIRSYIDMAGMPFNRGFYQLNIRIYVKICCEACLSPGHTQEISGIAAVEKKVVLFGSEGSINVFKSNGECGGFCPLPGSGRCAPSNNLPIAVLEMVDPLVLSSKIVEPHHPCCCCCTAGEIPESVCETIGCCPVDDDRANRLLVSLGFFSVVRLERPAQYLVNAVEYCVPEKECLQPPEDDPCSVFRRMKFPVSEFCPPACGEISSGCGCEIESGTKKCCGNA